MRLGAERAALAFVLLLALSLVGVPFILRPRDMAAVRGVVLDGRGFGVPEVAVFLFDVERRQLLEETRTEARGDFAFHLSSRDVRVFVRPPEASGFLPAWGPAHEDGVGRQALVLQPARGLELAVRGPDGQPLAGAEVCVYERRVEAVALDLARTGADGRAHLLAPARADVRVREPRSGLARWRFDLEVPVEGGELVLDLPTGRRVRGVVRGPEGPLAGAWISAEADSESTWSDFATSAGDGGFELCLGLGPATLRVLDPTAAHLPLARRLATAELAESSLALELERATPLVVRIARNGLPLAARVWSWSGASEAWSFGARTDVAGRARVPVGARYGLRAEPLDPAFAPLELWDVDHAAGTLHLEASPRR
jgi:hypothetical protein